MVAVSGLTLLQQETATNYSVTRVDRMPKYGRDICAQGTVHLCCQHSVGRGTVDVDVGHERQQQKSEEAGPLVRSQFKAVG